MQEIATIPRDAASLHGHVPGNLFLLALADEVIE
jgi:hypothetical protein